MAVPSGAIHIPRDRSRVVCEQCHRRKVRCNLITKVGRGGKCSNCEARAEMCERRIRDSSKRQKSSLSVHPRAIRRPPFGTPPASISSDLPGEPSPSGGHLLKETSSEPGGEGYVGELSVLSNKRPRSPEAIATLGSRSRSIERRILAATGAVALPPQAMLDAFITAFHTHLYHRMPVVDPDDISCSSPSTLLLSALCFAGSLLRHPKAANTLMDSEEFYNKAKVLIYTNYERDQLTMLKSLSILALWNVKPPSVVTLDSSWNLLGLAIRLALQMGLHRERTYAQRSFSGCARRVAWYLYTQDKVQAACFGRPPMLNSLEFDLRPLRIDDFPSDGRKSRLFILHVELVKVLARMLPLNHRQHARSREEVLSILADFQGWAQSLPSDCQILDDHGNRAYRRDVYEVLISYFTYLITFFHLCGSSFQQSIAQHIPLVASSCIVQLYKEMDFRDDINYLMAINNWYMMVASLPQLGELAKERKGTDLGDNTLASEELNILKGILNERLLKFPGARAIVEAIAHLEGTTLPGVDTPARPSIVITGMDIPWVHQLFPIPRDSSPRMALLDAIPTQEIPEALFEDNPSWTIEDIFHLEGFEFEI